MAAGVRAVAAAGPADSGNGASTAGGGPASIPRAPGSVVVPCRARGMPMDHNFRVSLLSSFLCAIPLRTYGPIAHEKPARLTLSTQALSNFRPPTL
jgi:hypothetical protein